MKKFVAGGLRSIPVLAGFCLLLSACGGGGDGGGSVSAGRGGGSGSGGGGGAGGSGPTIIVSPVAVSAVFPNEARAGDTIAVSGQRFGATQGASTLRINGAVATQIASWSDTQIEATVPAGATTGNVTVTVDGVAGAPGHLIVLWQATNPANVAVSAAAGDQNAPQIIADGAGGAFMVWEDLRDGNPDIYAQRLNNAGVPQWTANGVAVRVAVDETGTVPRRQAAPQLIADGAGGTIIVWQDLRNGSYDIYAQRLDSAGAPQWTANGVAINVAVDEQSAPQLIPDGAGGAIIVWQDQRRGRFVESSGGTTPGFDVYAQRIDGAGVLQWTAEGVAISAQDREQGVPQLISDGAGGAIIVWQDNRSGNNRDIYVQRVDAAGVPQWTADGIVVADAGISFSLLSQPTSQNIGLINPQLATDGTDGAIVVWRDFDNNVYAQRINGVGVPQWATSVAIPIPGVPNDALQPTLVTNVGVPVRGLPRGVSLGGVAFAYPIPDGVGGAIIAWNDVRSIDFGVDVYAQRLNNAGVPQWATNGVAVSTAVNGQSSPRIVSDGTGGAIVAWNDARTSATSGTDIYAQRLDAAGILQWPEATVISTATGDQTVPQLVTDGTGGAIVVWQDRRDGNNDVYAQRIGASGRQ